MGENSASKLNLVDESEGEVAARSVSKVKIATDSDTDSDATPQRKKRRRRNVKRDNSDMEVDNTKNSKSASFLKPSEASSSARMDWESDPDLKSDDSWSYLDADDEQSDFPDYAFDNAPKPDGPSGRKCKLGMMTPLIQRKLERFYYSNQRELLLTHVAQLYPIEKFIKNKKMSVIKRGKGVIVIRKH